MQRSAAHDARDVSQLHPHLLTSHEAVPLQPRYRRISSSPALFQQRPVASQAGHVLPVTLAGGLPSSESIVHGRVSFLCFTPSHTPPSPFSHSAGSMHTLFFWTVCISIPPDLAGSWLGWHLLGPSVWRWRLATRGTRGTRTTGTCWTRGTCVTAVRNRGSLSDRTFYYGACGITVVGWPETGSEGMYCTYCPACTCTYRRLVMALSSPYHGEERRRGL